MALTCVLIGDIALDEDGVASGSLELLGRLLAVLFVPIHDHDFGAFLDKDLGNAPSNSLGCAGDDRYFPLSLMIILLSLTNDGTMSDIAARL